MKNYSKPDATTEKIEADDNIAYTLTGDESSVSVSSSWWNLTTK